ncbi:MAG: hypothetical protein KAV87_68895, partial [Desulfobacteraceae bacterium]|nr:hypothetical protein [Desulfobacteraceae bacterium]
FRAEKVLAYTLYKAEKHTKGTREKYRNLVRALNWKHNSQCETRNSQAVTYMPVYVILGNHE